MCTSWLGGCFFFFLGGGGLPICHPTNWYQCCHRDVVEMICMQTAETVSACPFLSRVSTHLETSKWPIIICAVSMSTQSRDQQMDNYNLRCLALERAVIKAGLLPCNINFSIPGSRASKGLLFIPSAKVLSQRFRRMYPSQRAYPCTAWRARN